MAKRPIRVTTRPDGHHLERWVEGHWGAMAIFETNDLAKAMSAFELAVEEATDDLTLQPSPYPVPVDDPEKQG